MERASALPAYLKTSLWKQWSHEHVYPVGRRGQTQAVGGGPSWSAGLLHLFIGVLG